MSSPPGGREAAILSVAAIAASAARAGRHARGRCRRREAVLVAGAGAAGGDPRSVAIAAGAGLPQAVRGHENRSEEHTSELQSHLNLVCRLLLEKKKIKSSSQGKPERA